MHGLARFYASNGDDGKSLARRLQGKSFLVYWRAQHRICISRSKTEDWLAQQQVAICFTHTSAFNGLKPQDNLMATMLLLRQTRPLQERGTAGSSKPLSKWRNRRGTFLLSSSLNLTSFLALRTLGVLTMGLRSMSLILCRGSGS